QTRPSPGISAHDVRLEGVRASRFTLRTPEGSAEVALELPGLYNVYNALAAAALGSALSIPFQQIVAGLTGARGAFGRSELVDVRTAAGAPRRVQILLVKNPAGANEILRTLVLEHGEHDLLG